MTTWIDGVCETNGISVHYLRTGGVKPAVVLLHGLMGSAACWSPLARALEGEFVTSEMATELQSRNRRMRIEQVKGAGHSLPFEQPERLGEVVVSFLSQLA